MVRRLGGVLGLAIAVYPLLASRKSAVTFSRLDAKMPMARSRLRFFELGKDVVRVTLAMLETRTRRKVEYEDEEARNSGRGN